MGSRNRESTLGLSTIVNAHSKAPLHSHVSPIFQTSSFSFGTVEQAIAAFQGNDNESYVYSRGRNPNAESLQSKLVELEARDLARKLQKPAQECASARVFSSGMGAISGLSTAILGAGDTTLIQSSIYGGTFNLFKKVLPRMGVNVVWVDGFDLDVWAQAIDQNPNAKLAYAETPSNPTMNIVDLNGLAKICHARDIKLAVDNTFATPVHQQPLFLGADYVVQSLTKFICGHATNLGGAVISKNPNEFDLFSDFWEHAVELGACLSPFDCWLTEMGLKTLELRMERHSSNALSLAQMLEDHPKVRSVAYPGLENHPHHALAKSQMKNGFSGLLTFELEAGLEGAHRLLDHLTIPSLAISLGSVDTLVQCPALMTHSNLSAHEQAKVGITPGQIRMSVGIENVDDLRADFETALTGV